MKNKIRAVIWGVLTAAAVCFIIANSLKNGDDSMTQSSWFVELFKFIFDPNGTLGDRTALIIVRKTAHFAEFTALGFCSFAFLHFFERVKEKKYCGITVFGGLFVAVCDEFVQSFTGRTSSARDILIDFAGVLFGTLLIGLVFKIKHRKRNYIRIEK